MLISPLFSSCVKALFHRGPEIGKGSVVQEKPPWLASLGPESTRSPGRLNLSYLGRLAFALVARTAIYASATVWNVLSAASTTETSTLGSAGPTRYVPTGSTTSATGRPADDAPSTYDIRHHPRRCGRP